MVRALGGQVISLGSGRDVLNPLDVGDVDAVAGKLSGREREALIGEGKARQLQMVLALLQVVRRNQPVSDREEAIISRALDVWNTRGSGTPLLSDVVAVIDSHPDACDAVALSRGDARAYRAATDQLQASLLALLTDRWAQLFGHHTTTPMRLDRPVVFDVSDLDRQSNDVLGAVLLTCWSYGFAQVNLAQVLQDASLMPQRHYFIVMDELWRILRAGQGMVDRIDELTRLNRTRGVGQAMCTHTMKDLMALPNEEDRMKACGFVERSGMVISGGLPANEMPQLTSVVPMSGKEQATLASWTNPPSWNNDLGHDAPPPGRGKFLIKVGERPGIPFQVRLTQAELALNDTNKRWSNTTSARHRRG
ncbi:ATP/GTP-binding protein [Nanchangia anserum]|uniref:ATP/GTP-binding protein n=1 Tax=Nanchangia anserum TaxID=2692125 RepID=A0A8I0GCS2_9ACTO|nr:ATP/GTP-binding protein [Nanchangia anserum]MBD3689770.1 ATP/GTP-binding protein [Nanchangia anserum]